MNSAHGGRGNVDGVLQHAGNRAIVFRSDEYHAVGRLDPVAKGEPFGGRVGLEVLVEEPELMQRHNLEFQRIRRQFGHGIGDLERKRLLAETANDDERAVRGLS